MQRALALLLLLPGVAMAAEIQVVSKVDRVEVYSGQARVYRASTLTLPAGPTAVVLADLPEAADPDSVRAQCRGADIQHLEVRRTRDKLPRQAEARKLLRQIETLQARIQSANDERAIYQEELSLLDTLRPQSPPRNKRAEALPLFVDGWRQVLGWLDTRSAAARRRILELQRQQRELARELQPLIIEAKKLLTSSTTAPALRVVVTLKGRAGKHECTLSYLVSRAQWVPSYDLRYHPGRQQVEATYYAAVTQTTGEDWDGARMSFSTTLPAQIIAIPKLPTWTLGRRIDFTPTPNPRREPQAPTWTAPEPRVEADPVVSLLRQAVASVTLDGRVADGLLGGETTGARGDKAAEWLKRPSRPATRRPRPMPRKRMEVVREMDEAADAEREPAPSMAPPPAPPAEPMAVSGALAPSRAYRRKQSVRDLAQNLPWTDTAYRPPRINPNLPAASAKGHRFTLAAPGRHTVSASGTEARVPLMRQKFPVRPRYRIVPGRSKAAYLTAEVQNNTGRPILLGDATLFTGSLFRGQTRLKTALPGAKIRLPLGIDDAVKVSRVTTQRTVTEGVIFKDDVTEYTVQIEVANHRPRPIEVEVVDQVPAKGLGKAKITDFAASPYAKKPDRKGRVIFKGTVGASRVRKFTFKYRITRPKDWELQQHGG